MEEELGLGLNVHRNTPRLAQVHRHRHLFLIHRPLVVRVYWLGCTFTRLTVFKGPDQQRVAHS